VKGRERGAEVSRVKSLIPETEIGEEEKRGYCGNGCDTMR
jgi:hypothetical protein